ncbi:two pore domain potassium channel family protein [Pseudohalioglobus sediminis]|uniref:Two pore domain potassium channel family protein n=1 Tax=Pseudohalioglobus sediminis TaxID=2606449 RepID=A0A5B0WVC3_9GAMM|nr:potassium channel family protein [Pseudohalioglobus sediminis]KAA1190398.1 two pore domain potassium channel family protein [Pseudohalioglobus sediminis]
MLTVFLVNIVVIGAVVMIHYEFLYRFTLFMPRLKVRNRFRIVLGIFAALTAHAVEVWIFGFLYYWMHHQPGWGYFEGNFSGSVWDCIYFSFTTFTTLGFGDIEPIGNLRYLTGLEALTGLVLITWSASFLYLEMTRYWGRD